MNSETPLLLRPMIAADVPALHALSVEVGWPHRPDDWQFVLEVGAGVVACDAAERVVGSAMWWPFGEDFGTFGMIIVSPRLQARGTGRRLMRWLFAEAGGRTLQLNATQAGLRLYQSEGFREIGKIHQHQGVVLARGGERRAAGIRPVRDADWPLIRQLDAEAGGADRGQIFERLAERASGVVLEREGTLRGFSLCRPFGRGHVVGPIVAQDAEQAVALLEPHLAEHGGRFVRADTPVTEGPFADALEAAGLTRVDTAATMLRGERKKGGSAARTFAIVNQALG